MTPTFADLSETVPDLILPELDRANLDPSRTLTAEQEHWRRHGYLILDDFLPRNLIDDYCRVRAPLGPHGWPVGTPYMKVPELRDLCCYKPLSDLLEHLIGHPMALNLNLTGWVSTERHWHQDIYLNPDYIGGYYAAVWMALDDIHPDSGPFEFVPGSHRWPFLRREKVLARLTPEQRASPDWPRTSEGWVGEAFEREIERTGLPVRQFLGHRGDILIWHSRLAHRGSQPKERGRERRALIAHYSSMLVRHDMPIRAQHGDAGYYFVF